MYPSIVSTNSGTSRKTLRRKPFRVKSRKNRSAMLSRDELVGVKFRSGVE